MSITFYYHHDSSPSRTVQTFLHLTNIIYEPKLINLLKGDHITPEFLKINPRHTIPVIVDGDFALNESEAIIFYLMETRGVGKEYYPEDPKIRALVNQYLPYHHAMVRPRLSRLFNLVYLPQAIQGPKQNIRVEALDLLKQFGEVFLKEGKYIAGDSFTIADMFAANELSQIYHTVDVDFNQFPVVKEYLERCLENKVLNDVNEKIKGFPERIKKVREQMMQQQQEPKLFLKQ